MIFQPLPCSRWLGDSDDVRNDEDDSDDDNDEDDVDVEYCKECALHKNIKNNPVQLLRLARQYGQGWGRDGDADAAQDDVNKYNFNTNLWIVKYWTSGLCFASKEDTKTCL